MRPKTAFTLVALFVVLLTTAFARGVSAEGPPPPFVVIVHPQNPYVHVDRGFVADAFLKKATRWPNGDVIKPVDLPPSSRCARGVLDRC